MDDNQPTADAAAEAGPGHPASSEDAAKSPPRILVIHDGKMNDYGLDLVTAQQVQALVEAGYRVDLLARGPLDLPNVSSLTHRYTWANLFSWVSRIFYFDARKRAFTSLGRAQLRREDYVGVVAWVGGLLPMLTDIRRRGIPLFLNVPRLFEAGLRADAGYPDYENRQKWRWPRISQAEKREEFLDAATHMLLPSRYCRDRMAEAGAPGECLHVIERGYDPQKFFPAEARPDSFRLLFCGKAVPRKGVLAALQAWREAGLENAEFWFAGRIPERHEQAWREAATDNVRFLGFRSDLGDVMRQCHAQILLSDDEGQAKSLIEGAACGLVTIASSVTGFPFERGEVGFEVAAEDVAGVTSILRRLHGDPDLRRRISGEAARVMHENYPWAVFRQRFGATINAVLQRKTQPRERAAAESTAPDNS